MEVAGFLLLLSWLLQGGLAAPDVNLHVTRQNFGDFFTPEGINRSECSQETCIGLSSGTAGTVPEGDYCNCQCHPHLPAFREDLRICVDDIHECVLSPFVSSTTSQPIPFIFLPLKGQIIHPSKEISFKDVQTPVCAVSGAKFLTETGWVELRNPVDTDVPFRLFRDEGRTFLQWVGDADLRNKMSGRLVLVYLMCRDLATTKSLTPKKNTIFSPCVAFRVVGTPIKYPNNVSEVAFSSDDSATFDHLSVSEYVAIGISSVLLGLIYVASVLLYLHLRKRNKESPKKVNNQNLTNAEEGVVKSNPLLNIPHFQAAPDSDSVSSDTDITPDIIQQHNIIQHHSALVHSPYKRNSFSPKLSEINHQESNSIEKLPEENVSIVETLDGREERPDSLKAITGTVRRKLYFNPAYFEPQLLLAPPPAALEFLSKIREVITIAKQKMATKKFSPSLMGIPEEDNHYTLDPLYEFNHPSISRRSSIISLKRENSRRKCTGCPGCEPQDFNKLSGKLPEFPTLAACHNCATPTESKQRSIRKWLEDIPILRQHASPKQDLPRKRVRSPARSLPPNGIETPRALSPRPASSPTRSLPDKNGAITSSSINYQEKALSPPSSLPSIDHRVLTSSPPRSLPPNGINKANSCQGKNNIYKRPRKVLVKPKVPPPPPPTQHQNDSVPKMNFPPPDMIHEAMVVDEEIRIPTLTKKQMNAVINELTEIVSDPETSKRKIDYEADSLERCPKGLSTPTEYADISSTSQPSPSLSSALPMDEEMTMRNAIFNKNTGSMTISKIAKDDDDDYELIVLKRGCMNKQEFYKLPELLKRNNGYSLVSEVYVNNGYNYSSTPSSCSESDCSTLEKAPINIRYEEGPEKPGKLLIKVEDCLDNYIPVNDSDSFEPDTLDRKSTQKPTKTEQEFIDSLERPNQILLRSNGSFKTDSLTPLAKTNNLNCIFGSLREIYEAKTKLSLENQQITEGRLLTLEERHAKRQRCLNGKIVPPDVIPPPHHNPSPIYEHPKPPRPIEISDGKVVLKPPLPPKNANGRSVKNTADNGTPDKFVLHSSLPHTIQLFNMKAKTDDAGYLSTDSKAYSPDKGSESEESLEDGHSESGAESVETHSVFFGCFRKPNYITCGSIDSGVDADHNRQVAEDGVSSDSETISFTTVVPLNNFSS